MTDPVSRLGEIRERLGAAIGGKWIHNGNEVAFVDPPEAYGDVPWRTLVAFNPTLFKQGWFETCEFIAAAPADVGWLLEHIEQLQRENEGRRRNNEALAHEAAGVVLQRDAALACCAAWMERTPAERAAAAADPDPLTRSYHRGLVDGSATAIERIREALGADDDHQ